MTIEEKAIANLKYAIRWNDKPTQKSMEIAIASLEAWEKIKQEINDLFGKPACYMPNYDAYKMFLEIIDKHIKGGVRMIVKDTKQTDNSCLDFDFDKVKEILKKDGLDNLIVDHTCEKKQEQTRDKKLIDDIDFAIKATGSQDDYSMGMRNGMRYVKSLIDGKEPQYELRRTDEEMKLGIYIGDEVVSDYGAKGVVVGIDTYKGRPWLSLLMKNHKVPQLVDASEYKKTGRHFDAIEKLYEEMKK